MSIIISPSKTSDTRGFDSRTTLDLDASTITTGYGANHGISEWIAMESGSPRFATVYDNTSVYENGSLITTYSTPNSGNISVTAGNLYSADKPIHFLAESPQNHIMVPLSLKGKLFANYSVRNGASEFYIYPVDSEATSLEIFDATPNGINDTPTSTISLTQGTISTTQSSTENDWVYFRANGNIVMSVYETSGTADRMVMPPASKNYYRRRKNNETTMHGNTPAISIDNYAGDDIPVVAVEIADGAGLEATQGLGLENLSDRYAWGNSLSDYKVVAPNQNTVNVYHWSGSSWILWDTHIMSGTTESPDSAFRTGDDGPGVESSPSLDAGQSSFMASGDNLWKFEGTDVFHVTINDTTDDEETLFGWMSNWEQGYSFWKDLSGNSNDVRFDNLNSLPTHNENFLTFDGSTDRGSIPTLNYGTNNQISEMSVFAWVKTTYDSGTPGSWNNANWAILDFDRSEVFTFTLNGTGEIQMSGDAVGGNNGGIGAGFFDIVGNTRCNDGQWHHVGWTYSVSKQEIVMYVDGQVDATFIADGNMAPLGNGPTRYGIVGDGSEMGDPSTLNGNNIYFDGDLGKLTFIDSEALSLGAVKQLYNRDKKQF